MTPHSVSSILSVDADSLHHDTTGREPKAAKRRYKMATEQVLTADEKARKDAFDAAVREANEVNAKRSGQGTRMMVSSTRGRNTTAVTYEGFDKDAPETLPTAVAEFITLTGIDDDALLTAFLIDGYTDYQFRVASDPVAEYVNPVWSPEVAKSFKDSIKMLVKAGVYDSIEKAVDVIKPSVDAKFAVSA